MDKETFNTNESKVMAKEELEKIGADLVYELPENVIQQMNAGDFSGIQLGCIDGRRGGEKSDNVIPVPGGALGILQDMLSVALPDQHQIVFDTMREMLSVRNFGFHTDTHQKEDALSCAGCGHCAGALQNGELYQQSTYAVDFIQTTVLTFLESEGIKPAIYEGEHEEKGVIIISDISQSLVSQSEGKQVFTYHKGIHNLFIQKLCEKLAEKGIEISSEEVIYSAGIRTGVTVKKLALDKGLFVVNI